MNFLKYKWSYLLNKNSYKICQSFFDVIDKDIETDILIFIVTTEFLFII